MTIPFERLGEADVIALSEGRGEPDWLRDRRLEAHKVFTDLAWPTVRDEAWKYTNPRRYDWSRPFIDAPGQADPRTGGAAAGIRETAGGHARVVDGHTVSTTVGAEAAGRGVVVTDLATAVTDHAALVQQHLGTAVGPHDKLAAASLAAFSGGVFVHIPADTELDDPIIVDLQATAAGTATPRILVVADHHAKATIVVDRSGDAAQTVLEVLEVVVGTGASVDLLAVQDWGDQVDHVADHTGLVGEAGTFRGTELTFGGRTVYIRPDVHLDSPGATGELLGLYFTDTGQQFEHRSLLHHDAAKTTSDLLYKGALQGESRASWFGNVRIEAHAPGCASDETNRNLLLSEGAKADTVPFLEIMNSDVARCGHASSVGQMDELQLFYLESRGIPRPEAARLLVFGYFAEVADQITLPGVADWVVDTVKDTLRSDALTLVDPRRAARKDS